ncbi:MAG: peptide chain release factor N(5)-glutamine methyltransferase [Proteobacteria bacterium]|nr:peptide chain release factor N(5)-glutamine methyltransferase [Pseudomonadota bacterium]
MESSKAISKALAQAKQILNSKGVSNAGLDSLILLAHALSFSKEQIIFNPERQLTEGEERKFFDLINRRAAREPVSHLIGKREFFGEDFLVSRDVLDPRPDSEILIESVLKKFPDREKKLKILELGVGSGCLIITLLKTYRDAVGTAVDISETALVVAQKNSEKHQTNSRLKILKSDLFSALNHEEKFDLIISNPPYIPAADIEELEPEVRIHEPRTALDGGKDGLDFYRRIAAEAKNFLAESGAIFLEIGFGQSKSVTEIFAQNDFQLTSSALDLSGVIRVLEFK